MQQVTKTVQNKFYFKFFELIHTFQQLGCSEIQILFISGSFTVFINNNDYHNNRLCFSIDLILIHVNFNKSWGLNWGVAYDLPNDTWIINQRNQKILPKQIVQRRHRRELYDRLETLIDTYVNTIIKKININFMFCEIVNMTLF